MHRDRDPGLMANLLSGLSRSPRLATGSYVAAGLVAAWVAGLVSPLPLSPSMLVALGGWLLFSALLLFLVLEHLSRASYASAALRAREMQRAAQSCLDTIMTALPDALVVADETGIIRDLNPAAERTFGYARADALGEPVEGLLAEPFASDLHRRIQAYHTGSDTSLLCTGTEVLACRADGTAFPCEMSVAEMESDNARRFLVVMHDITARKRVLDRLDVAEKVLECTMEGVMVTDRKGTILWVNSGFCRISGYGRDEVLGKSPNMLKSGLQGPDFYDEMWKSIHERGEWAGEIWNRRKDGEAFPEWLSIRALKDSHGQVSRYVGVFSDISKHKRAEETIRTLTYYDPVTRLPNRHLFMDRVAQAMERAGREGKTAALVMLGLDRFKHVNESLGHRTGDLLLRAVAERLAGALRGHDTVARLRGDTFCCLLTDLTDGGDTHPVIARLLECFAPSYEVNGHELFVAAAVGISVYPMDGTDPDELVRKAETAMNRSKDMAENPYQFFTPEMHAHSIQRLKLDTELRKALTRNELMVHYQPKVDTFTGRVVGAEALLRWNHPELGMVSPVNFIPVAEETGLIVPIGQWVLDQVCAQLAQWRAHGIPLVQVAVNLSAHQFRQADLVNKVMDSLARHGIEPQWMQLELTESAVMRNADLAIRTLTELHGRGLHLAVDDFGTGYSSLSYLKKLPLDKVKIDRSFVHDIHINPASAEIVGAIIAMSHFLNLAVIAEGVENEAQLAKLRDLKCDEIQGYYYSRPLPADGFAGILRLGKV